MPRAPLTRRPARSSAVPRWLPPLAAALLAVAAYGNALHNPFVYDDRDTVTANPSIVDPSNVRFLLVYSPFRPVVNVSYALDRLAWGPEPAGFHATNIALHAGVAALLYYLLLALLADSGLTRGARAAAFIGAAGFALHPLQSEAVGYISGRSELLCALWFVASLLAARRAMASGRTLPAVLAFAFAALALASKEVAVMLPVVLLAYDWLLGPGGEEARRRRRRRYVLPALALVMVAGLVRLAALGAASAAPGLQAALLNLLTQSIVIWRYAALLVWPHGQSIMHAVHRVTTPTDPAGLAAIVALAAAIVLAVRVRRAAPIVTFGVIWYLAALAPSSSVIALREGMAEHRVYLANGGVFAIAAGGLAHWLARRPAAAKIPLALVALPCAVLLALGVLTVRRNAVWSNPVTLWSAAIPHAAGMWEPHYALADALREAGDCRGAIDAYQRVVELYPRDRDAYTNLGICLAQSGRTAEAEQAFRRALEIDPGFARGYTNLGALALLEGNPERARDFYREALARDSANVLARLQLASMFEHTFRDYHSAARMCGEARLIAPATAGVAECVARNQRLAAEQDQGR